MKKIVYTRPDGGISIVTPTISIDDVGMTEEKALQRAMNKSIPNDATNVRVVDENEIPTDRTFRNAWEDKNGKIEVNEVKKQAILIDRAAKDSV